MRWSHSSAPRSPRSAPTGGGGDQAQEGRTAFTFGAAFAHHRRRRSRPPRRTEHNLRPPLSLYAHGPTATLIGLADALGLEHPPWRRDALRVEQPGVTFFPEKGDSVAAAEAKAVCTRCLCRAEYLAYALADSSLVGIWGGTAPTSGGRCAVVVGGASGERSGREGRVAAALPGRFHRSRPPTTATARESGTSTLQLLDRGIA